MDELKGEVGITCQKFDYGKIERGYRDRKRERERERERERQTDRERERESLNLC